MASGPMVELQARENPITMSGIERRRHAEKTINVRTVKNGGPV